MLVLPEAFICEKCLFQAIPGFLHIYNLRLIFSERKCTFPVWDDCGRWWQYR